MKRIARSLSRARSSSFRRATNDNRSVTRCQVASSRSDLPKMRRLRHCAKPNMFTSRGSGPGLLVARLILLRNIEQRLVQAADLIRLVEFHALDLREAPRGLVAGHAHFLRVLMGQPDVIRPVFHARAETLDILY